MVSWCYRGGLVFLSFFGGSVFCEYIDVNALFVNVDERLNHSTLFSSLRVCLYTCKFVRVDKS